jgi:glyoxylate reductase
MKVLVTARLPEEVLGRITGHHQVRMHDHDLPMERQELLESIGDVEGLLCTITDRIDRELLDRAPRLKVIANNGVGFDHIDVGEATRRNIAVANTPGVLTEATADLTFALLLAAARRVVEGDRMVRAGEFKYWAPLKFLGIEVAGKTLGVVGMGRIGRAVAKRAAGFDMKVIYWGRSRLGAEREREMKVSFSSFDDLLRESDFVSLHVPLGPETRHLVGARELSLMKTSAVLINTSRGPVVDEKALVAALLSEEIRCAGLDVYENEPELSAGLAELDHVVLLPHVGSATIETRTRMAAMACDNLLAGLAGKRPPNCINCG